MSDGRPRTLVEFGWNSSQSAATQRANVQSAFDSGEPLFWPACNPATGADQVVSDGTLVMNYHTKVTGAGPDLVQAETTIASVLKCSTAGIPAIHVRGHNCRISDLDIRPPQPGGIGIQVGDGVTLGYATNGFYAERVSTNWNFARGIYLQAATHCYIVNSFLYGQDAAIYVSSNISNDPLSADSGDNFILGNHIFGAVNGVGIRWRSSGGLVVTGNKFLKGTNHINMQWDWGGSGSLVLTGNSLESCSGISLDMYGNQPFKRATIVGNNWGGINCAVAVRNYAPYDWLQDLLITGNDFDADVNPNGYPILDIGRTAEALISNNIIRGNGTAQAGIIVRNGTGAVGPNRIIGCTAPVVNSAGASWNIATQL